MLYRVTMSATYYNASNGGSGWQGLPTFCLDSEDHVRIIGPANAGLVARDMVCALPGIKSIHVTVSYAGGTYNYDFEVGENE